jgi:hypothetical protein
MGARRSKRGLPYGERLSPAPSASCGPSRVLGLLASERLLTSRKSSVSRPAEPGAEGPPVLRRQLVGHGCWRAAGASSAGSGDACGAGRGVRADPAAADQTGARCSAAPVIRWGLSDLLCEVGVTDAARRLARRRPWRARSRLGLASGTPLAASTRRWRTGCFARARHRSRRRPLTVGRS